MRRTIAVLFALVVLDGWPATATAQTARWLPPVRIAVVWPHDSLGLASPVARASSANVSVWPTNQVACDRTPDPAVLSPRLMVAVGNEPTRFVEAAPHLIRRTVGAVSFPSLEWDDVPTDPSATYRFAVYAIGVPIGGNFYSNVWGHAGDGRTLLAQPAVAEEATADLIPRDGVDARIQVVWPHDNSGQYAPPERASLVNVAVELFQHGTRRSLPAAAISSYAVRLLAAEGNGPLTALDLPKTQRTSYSIGGRLYPRWVFDDVPVKPTEQTNFMVSAIVAGGKLASPYSTVWTHAADPRTAQSDPTPAPTCTA